MNQNLRPRPEDLIDQTKYDFYHKTSCDEVALSKAYLNTLEQFNDTVAFCQLVENQWVYTTYKELCENVKKTSTFFSEKLKIRNGEKIAILSESSSEYVEIILASIYTGTTVIALDAQNSAEELFYILKHSAPLFIFVSSTYKKLVSDIFQQLENLPKIIEIDPKPDKNSELHKLIKDLSPASEPQPRNSPYPLFISYTSGTMGSPKGVQIQLKNILFEIQSLRKGFGTERMNYLSLLPINHLFELTGGILSPLTTGSKIVLANTKNPIMLLKLFQKHEITRMLAVPIILEMLQFGIERKIQESPVIKLYLFRFLHLLSNFFPVNRIRRFLFKSVHQQFGNHFQDFVVGGAKLTEQLYDYFTQMGFNIYQGYGLTETAPVICVNTPENNQKSSVGKPFDSIDIKIDGTPEGPIYIRGPNVFLGYLKNEEETAKAFTDDWFNTGDIGYKDKNGYIYITGRSKNLIVLKTGKKIYPEEVESVLIQCPFVKEVVVLADKSEGSEKVAAIVVMSNPTISEKEALEALLEYKRKLSDYKWPTRFKFQYTELPKTSTQKIKRREVYEIYHSKN